MNPFDPKPNSTKVATKWALIYTAVSIVLTFTFQFLNVDQTSPIKYVSFIPFIAFLVLAQTEYKQQLKGFITYGEAFSAGFRYALFAGLILGVFMYIYLGFINPNMLVQAMEAQHDKYVEAGMSDEQIEKATAMGTKYGAIFGAFGAAVGSAISGVIVSLISAAIVKKEKSPMDIADELDSTPTE
ncbi:DUF4199 domain-containing protein [Mucilaginibacter mali]|uniref:DUF4199 domain-containing protein n=1 Tax=Mucilaginibacter mali TaxID=2740462 RepID=A0A7D4Q2E6_9SPHI|nr:DUF4199 domain-containing protein [Mucilaginibacter mali]QKJ29607.1 DUF4199 domain-containing protein [Mucilaginibacter mali]